MADVDKLKQLSRDKLNEFAAQNGIADGADESKYMTKGDLATALSPNVTNEQLDAFKAGAPAPEQPAPTAPEVPAEQPPADENQQPSDDESEEEEAPEEPNPPAEPLPTPPIDSPDDVNDQSGTEPAPGPEEEDEDEEDNTPPQRAAAIQDDEGMGFPRAKGKTLSVFSKKPHETVRNVGNIMVPMTMEEAVGDSNKGIAPKTDAEAIAALKKLGKL